jgi:hypothetical protein
MKRSVSNDGNTERILLGLESPSIAPGSPLYVARLVVVIRLLSLSRKGIEVVIRAEMDSSPVLDSEVPGTIVSLRERFEAMRHSEIHRVRRRLCKLSSDQERVVESLSRGIIEKVLQAPVAMLLNAAAANQSALILETVRRIFNLRTQGAVAAVEDRPSGRENCTSIRARGLMFGRNT